MTEDELFKAAQESEILMLNQIMLESSRSQNQGQFSGRSDEEIHQRLMAMRQKNVQEVD